MSNVPNGLKYTKEHEWLKVDGNLATVGITDHAQHALGDIVFVELPKVGTTVTAMKPLGTVESVKAASDLFSPISGKVAEINTSLANAPETVNKDPYGKGWMVKIQASNPAEFNTLLDAAAYQAAVVETK